MRSHTLLLFLLLGLVGCSRTPAQSGGPRPEPPRAAVAGAPTRTAAASRATTSASDVRLAPSGEPGPVLTVTGVLVRADDQTPIGGHRFRVYQADATGDYQATNPGDERTARLGGDVTTDAAGRFTIRTILPGVYGTPPGDPHLHIEVSGAAPAMHSVYFQGFLQDSTIRWAKTTEQGHIIPVTRSSEGAISGQLVLPVRGVGR